MSYSNIRKLIVMAAALAAVGTFGARAAAPLAPCRIEVVEKGSGWPVPLVELRATDGVVFVTDNAGVAAFDLPECMGRETWLSVFSHGYELPKDGFGNRGVRFVPAPGGRQRIELTRTIVAKRLGRLTGAGIFGESQKFGERLDWKESGVVGSDTVQVANYRGKLFWAWGDTGVFSYPLGIFNTSSATSASRPLTTFQPPLALAYEYFRNPDGKPRGVVDIKSDGPIWVSGYVALPDRSGREHLVCTYTKIRNMLEGVETGLAEWDDASASFKPTLVLWKKSDAVPQAPPRPDGHPAFWQDGQGKRWVYFANQLPNLRCPATYEDWKNPDAWQKIEAHNGLTAAKTGEKVEIASGSIAWNPWRKRWVTVFARRSGKASFLGELWYAEADAPEGPWGRAVKVLEHQNYTFYNPRLHAELTPADSPVLLFEGTYTAEFADHAVPTPRYNYNQVLYRLDLDDPALAGAQIP